MVRAMPAVPRESDTPAACRECSMSPWEATESSSLRATWAGDPSVTRRPKSRSRFFRKLEQRQEKRDVDRMAGRCNEVPQSRGVDVKGDVAFQGGCAEKSNRFNAPRNPTPVRKQRERNCSRANQRLRLRSSPRPRPSTRSGSGCLGQEASPYPACRG